MIDYKERFTLALHHICGECPPSHLVEDWILHRNEDLQEWVLNSTIPWWVMGIGVIEAAMAMANAPIDGEPDKIKYEESEMIVLVGGTFDADGGKESRIVDAMTRYMPSITQVINGGTLEGLNTFVDLHLDKTSTLIWMPNIDNSEDKILPTLKKRHPEMILVQSKRCVERQYTPFQLVKRMLSSHSALLMRITLDEFDNYAFSLMDPLGNIFGSETGLYTFCSNLSTRLATLQGNTRVRTERHDDRRPFELEDEFLEVVKSTGETFSKLMDAINPERFLGNASTRCEHGFPSVRQGHNVFVSKRNVDKTIIDSSSFVEVLGYEYSDDLKYLGDNKPSVDTPIQFALYDYYPNIKYMIHGHVYIEGAVKTLDVIPCGCLEEVAEIIERFPDPSTTKIAINLKGHGCIVMSDDLEYLKSQTYISRPAPEHHGVF